MLKKYFPILLCAWQVASVSSHAVTEVYDTLRIEDSDEDNVNTDFGLEVYYKHDVNDTSMWSSNFDEIRFSGTDDTNVWSWGYVDSQSYFVEQMRLEPDNTFSFFNNAATPVATIQIDPVAKKIMIDGQEVLVNSSANSHSLLIGTGVAAYGATSVGYYGTASGFYSFAGGNGADATASYSFAYGKDSKAQGQYSVAFGEGRAYGDYSFAMGEKDDSDVTSSANNYSFAFGQWAEANAISSFAFGYEANSYGQYGFAFGQDAGAHATHSFAFGRVVDAKAYASTVFGKFNEAPVRNSHVVNSAVENALDPVFEIGVGANYADRKNALTVYRDGHTTISGDLEVTGQILGLESADATQLLDPSDSVALDVQANQTVVVPVGARIIYADTNVPGDIPLFDAN